MIEEAYVSYDIARRLKEKGFDGDCYSAYDTSENIESAMELYGELTICNSECSEGDIAAPTQQMALRWLREAKGVFVKIDIDGCGYYQFSVYRNGSLYSNGDDTMVFDSYELAVGFGLLFVLTKIEL